MNDDMNFDELDLEDMYGPEDLTPEDVFKAVMLNREKGVRLCVELRDKDNDIVLIKDIVEELLLYMKDKMESPDNNDFTNQILPLIAQASVSGLGRLIGIPEAGAILTSDTLRFATHQMMGMSLLLLKFIQKKELKIYSYEEEISEEEIEDLDRRSAASRVAMMGSTLGLDTRELLAEMLRQGKITKEDIEELTGEKNDSGDEN